ncbi:PEGA domain-containing protein [Candidatus Saccharibacteria bacterium]|nr:PEGA domain-containing protein [Candidatus Saccharibacteria bacterium]
MDLEKRARRQSRRVIISEIIMVITVILTVSVLAFVVSGYWLGSDFTIERQGMAQIYSIPTGADISIDGSSTSWLQRTNTSKTLSAGEHTITLTKDGYDSWSRTVNINEGLLYRLHYPRLFLKNRTHESAFESFANFATVSPDRNTMLLANNTTKWQLFNLDSDSSKPASLELSEILPFSSHSTDSSTGLFNGTIKSAEWAKDNEHILLEIVLDDVTNWLVLNIKNPATSLNLTKEFNLNLKNVEIYDNSASNLLCIADNSLRRIDVPSKQISAILVSGVNSYDHYEKEVVFSAMDIEVDTSPYYIGIIDLGNTEITKLKPASSPAQVVITRFYDDKYIGIVENDTFSLYLKNDFVEKSVFPLSFTPTKIKVGHEGDFIALSTGGRLAVLDMEAMKLDDWTTGTDVFGWLDGSMVYAVKDGNLNVYDFNGLNPRTLATNVSSRLPVTITSDKYLYYFRDGSLIRDYLYEK